MKFNWASQLNDFRGLLIFAAVSPLPQVTIPLFIKDHPVPVRQAKNTEINTLSMLDRGSNYIQTSALFQGSPDPLTLGLSGWVITPTVSRVWSPTTNGASSGTSLGLTSVSYIDLIYAYLEGRVSSSGSRVDPYQYVEPSGKAYLYPKVLAFEGEYTPVYKKQSFSMTLWLEEPYGFSG